MRLIPILDGHNDTLKDIYLRGRDFLTESKNGHLDLPRAARAGFAGGFFATLAVAEREEERAFGYGLTLTDDGWEVAYANPVRQEFASRFTDKVLSNALRLTDRSSRVRLIRTRDDLGRCLAGDGLAMILHFEGAEAIAADLSNLETYYEQGLRSLGPVWSRQNAFGFGVPFKFPSHPDTGPGLSSAGKRLVRECNRLGIMVDTAHITLKGFHDIADLSAAPLVVTHAGVHAICPSTTNLLDEQIEVVAQSGGVIGIIFDVLNTRPDGKLVYETPIEVVVRHIDYVAQHVGIDHVALGSDFDGGQMPQCLSSVEVLPALVDALERRGYGAHDLEKIAHGNWLRVIGETWKA